jgi:hypothetical protein
MSMDVRTILPVIVVLCGSVAAGGASEHPHQLATVPMTVDHNRLIVDVQVPQPGGESRRLRAWVDTGNPDLWITDDGAAALGLEFTEPSRSEGNVMIGVVRRAGKLFVGGRPVDLEGLREVLVMSGRSSIAPGMEAALNLPSRVLRQFDIVIDYTSRQVTFAAPGSIEHRGRSTRVFVNPDNGIIQVPSEIDGERCHLGLDVGASATFLMGDRFARLRARHPRWSFQEGAIGEANLWGSENEPATELLRVARLGLGAITLTDIVVASLPTEYAEALAQRAGVATCGLVGGNAFRGCRLGIDYGGERVYMERTGSEGPAPTDWVGLILRPEVDGRYTVAGVAPVDGAPAVAGLRPGDELTAVDAVPVRGLTMGSIWSRLSGRPGEKRSLEVQRDGRRFIVEARVYRFLASRR